MGEKSAETWWTQPQVDVDDVVSSRLLVVPRHAKAA